jgi:peptidoglycan/LPS O-acetylase OafA/YrhL
MRPAASSQVVGRQRGVEVEHQQARMLRRAFLLGAITDALALIPMLFPRMASLLWGFHDVSGSYRFAMGYGATLMLGWTVLLLWAHQRPIERRFVAALTVLVICGLVATEVLTVASGQLEAWRMLPTWCLQAVLLVLFVSAYHHPWVKRWVAA